MRISTNIIVLKFSKHHFDFWKCTNILYHGRATFQHEWAGLTSVIPRPYRIPVWKKVSENTGGPYCNSSPFPLFIHQLSAMQLWRMRCPGCPWAAVIAYRSVRRYDYSFALYSIKKKLRPKRNDRAHHRIVCPDWGIWESDPRPSEYHSR